MVAVRPIFVDNALIQVFIRTFNIAGVNDACLPERALAVKRLVEVAGVPPWVGKGQMEAMWRIFSEKTVRYRPYGRYRTVFSLKIRHIASIWPFPTHGGTPATSTRRFTASARSGKHASLTPAMLKVRIKTCISALSTNMGLTATKPASKSTVISRQKATISLSAARWSMMP